MMLINLIFLSVNCFLPFNRIGLHQLEALRTDLIDVIKKSYHPKVYFNFILLNNYYLHVDHVGRINALQLMSA